MSFNYTELLKTVMINILIVEDQKLIREGLTALLTLEEDIAISGEAENGRIALALLDQLPKNELPEVAPLDMRMPVMDGVATAAVLSQRYPTIKILVLTTFDDDELVAQAMAQAMAVGARGYLLKDTPSEELAMAIRSVAKGYSHFGPGIVQKMMGTRFQALSGGETANYQEMPAEVAALTPREKEVFTLIGQEASNREIAKQMHLSEGTIKNHVSSILSQLGLRDTP